MVAQATAQSGSGQLENSREVLRAALERIPSDSPARLPIVAFCAGVEHLLGRHADAQARLRRALRLTADGTSAEAVSLQLELASGAGFQNRYDETLDWARQAHEGATRLGARAMAVTAAGQIALARYFKGQPTDDAVQRAAQGFDDLDDDELATRLDLGLWVGWTEAVLEHHERAVADCQRVLDVARATSQGATLLVTMTAQAWALLRMGRLDDADATLTAALDTGRLSPHLFLSVAVGLSAVLATYRGDHDAAVRHGEECVRLARDADAGLIPGMSGVYLAIPLIEIGDAERARDVILAMSRGNPELETSRSGYVTAFEILTRAEVALGRVDAAAQWAQRAEAVASTADLGARRRSRAARPRRWRSRAVTRSGRRRWRWTPSSTRRAPARRSSPVGPGSCEAGRSCKPVIATGASASSSRPRRSSRASARTATPRRPRRSCGAAVAARGRGARHDRCGGAVRARARGGRARAPGPHESRDCHEPLHQPEDRRAPPLAHLLGRRRREPHRAGRPGGR